MTSQVIGISRPAYDAAALRLPIVSTLFGSLLVGILLYQHAVCNTERSRIALTRIAVLFLGSYISLVEMYFADDLPFDYVIQTH
jgi:hypothetical protein